MSIDKRLANDDLVDELVKEIMAIVQRRDVQRNKRGEWFATSQLDEIRCLVEAHGWRVARTYQVGKIDDRDNRLELARNGALLDIIDVAAQSDLTTTVLSYMIGKLNSILADALHVKRRLG